MIVTRVLYDSPPSNRHLSIKCRGAADGFHWHLSPLMNEILILRGITQ